MPNSKTYFIAGAVFVVGAFFSFAIVQAIGYKNVAMIFILGTLCAIATFSWHAYARGLRWQPVLAEKIKIGVFLACIALTVVAILHFLFHPFAVPVVTFVITPMAVFVFPVILLDQFCSAWNKDLEKKK